MLVFQEMIFKCLGHTRTAVYLSCAYKFSHRHSLFLQTPSYSSVYRCSVASLTGFKLSRTYASASTNIFDLLNTMPKENVTSVMLRSLRKTVRDNALKKPQVPPSEVYLSVLGNGSRGTPRCLCVFTDHKRYIFNCGEGTQRLAQEQKAKLSKVHHVFFTHKSWQNIGGLPGLSLTAQDMGVPEITLHGSPDIENIYPMTKHFLMTKGINIIFRPYSEGAFEDNCFHITPVTLTPSTKSEEADTTSPDSGSPRSEESTDVSVAYICKLIPKAGQLLLEKCVDLGVPCGPMLGELKNGKDITLENGVVVKASDVLAPPEPPLSFIVVECPNENFLDSLLSQQAFEEYQMKDKCATAVVHFTPAAIVQLDKYQQWISRFPPETSHLYLCSDELLPSFVGVHRLQCKLNFLDPTIFPSLCKPEEIPPSTSNHYSPVECSSRFLLRPTVRYDRSSVVQLTYADYMKELQAIPNIDIKISRLHQDLEKSNPDATENCQYPSVVFLGTGSSVPSKVRNVSSILVELNKSSSILLDCGEGTYGQLLRLYGASKTDAVLASLKTIFISHLHADHHMGLLMVLLEREKVLSRGGQKPEPVNLIAPCYMQDFLSGYHKMFEPVLHLISLVPCHVLELKEKTILPHEYHQLLRKCDLLKLCTVYVRHCKNAFGLALTTKCEKTIVYSGDTMPSSRLVEAGIGCDLLIHEATMEDDLHKEAEIKTHSTTSQAITIGKEMGANYTILTHFSQRYGKVPLFNSNFHSTLGVAFDNMKVNFSDLPKLPLLIPVLKSVFQEDYEIMQQRTKKRKFEEEILKSHAGGVS